MHTPRAVLALLLALAAGLAPACSGSGAARTAGSAVVLVASDAPGTSNVAAIGVGRELVIRLAGNATTGYAWSCAAPEGTALLPILEPTYIPDPAPPGVVGTAGHYEFRFRGALPGTSTLRFSYARPWEKDTPPARTTTVTVTVN